MTTNQDRAKWARVALEQYLAETRHNPADIKNPDWDEVVRDLLGDLMHFCAAQKIDFAQELTWAEGNFNNERDEENDEENDDE